MADASASSSSASLHPPRAAVAVPSLGAEETATSADEAFRRHTSPGMRRGGGGAGGVAVVWFRSDLRVLDNEALARAWAASEAVLPVYCVDPRVFGSGGTHRFGFPKNGALRAQFLIECLGDLKENLQKRGLDLLVRHGKPEDILPSVATAVSANTVSVSAQSILTFGRPDVDVPSPCSHTPCTGRQRCTEYFGCSCS